MSDARVTVCDGCEPRLLCTRTRLPVTAYGKGGGASPSQRRPDAYRHTHSSRGNVFPSQSIAPSVQKMTRSSRQRPYRNSGKQGCQYNVLPPRSPHIQSIAVTVDSYKRGGSRASFRCFSVTISSMRSLFQVSSMVQPLLPLKQFPMNGSIENAIEPNETSTNVVQKPTPSTPSAPLMSTQTDVSSMLMSMASLPTFSSLRDYMKFFVLGGAFEVLRRTYSASYSSLVERFFIRASFDSEDDVYRELRFLHNPTSSLYNQIG
jgi:hypothetical protein